MTQDQERNLDAVDKVDMGILHLLQQDARDNTTSEIGEEVGVSSSTVGNRINKLEEQGIITSYQPTLDYEKVGFDQHLLILGTVPLKEIESMADQILEVSGVVAVRELLTNEQNLTIELVGANRGRIKEILHELSSIGIHIDDMKMMNQERNRPFNGYGEPFVSCEKFE